MSDDAGPDSNDMFERMAGEIRRLERELQDEKDAHQQLWYAGVAACLAALMTIILTA